MTRFTEPRGFTPTVFGAVTTADAIFLTHASYNHAIELATYSPDAGFGLTRDLEPGFNSLSIRSAIAVDGGVFFSARVNDGGFVLGRSDGSPRGTSIFLRDLEQPNDLAHAHGGFVFSVGVDAGRSLWWSDGTAAGTSRISGWADAGDEVSSGFTLFGSDLYFRGGNPRALWRTDGTVAGTVQVSSIEPMLDNAGVILGTARGDQFFFVSSSPGSSGLWQTDGSIGSLSSVAPFNSGAIAAEPLAAAGGLVFFAADGGLWRTDGTSSGTMQVGQVLAPNALLTSVGSLVFFRGPDAELWRSDGTVAGTFSIPMSDGPIFGSALGGLTPYGNRLLLVGFDYERVGTGIVSAGRSLWITDGSPSGASVLAGIHEGLFANPIDGVFASMEVFQARCT